jgi:hypothetical protein
MTDLRTSFVADEGPYGDPGFLWAKWLDTLSQQEREAMERRDDMRRKIEMVFKKDLSALSKHGRVIKHQGKGSSRLTPDPMAAMTNRYPAAPQPPAPPTSAPPLGGPALGSAPPAGPLGTGIPDDAA